MLGGAALALVIRGFLFGVEPLDPVTFVGVPFVLFATALVAGWVPALRPSAVEAVEALRHD